MQSAQAKTAANTGATDANDPQRIGVLLLHGLTGMPDEMRPVTKHLKSLGYQVDVPVLPGHGGTHHELLAVRWPQWYEASREGVKRLRAQGCNKIFAGGLSMGAILSLLLALEEDLCGIILLSPTMNYDVQSPRLFQLRSVQRFIKPFVLTKLVGNSIYWTEQAPYGLRDPRLQKQVTKAIAAAQSGDSNEFGLFRTYWGSLAQLWLMVEVFSKRSTEITIPVSIISSYEDTIGSVNNPAEVYNLLSGTTDKTLHLLTGCDHVLTLDLCKDQVAKIAGKFIARVASNQVALTG